MKNKNVNIYSRLVKYPMFPVSPKTYVEQDIKGYKAIMTSKYPVSVNTGEKLFGILYLLKIGSAEITHFKTENLEFKDDEVIIISFKMSEYAKLFDTHDYNDLLDELDKLQGITISYEYPRGGRWTTSPILAYKYKDGKIKVIMERLFFDLCNNYPLYINYECYTKLNKLEKNIYKILISNLNKNKISIETLMERCLTSLSSKKDFKKKLKRCIQKLIQLNILENAQITKDFLTYSVKNPKPAIPHQDNELIIPPLTP